MRFIAFIAAVALFAACVPLDALADSQRDHDRARIALERGEIMPLPRILEIVERDYPGQIIEVELERDDGRWIYEIKLLRAGGALVKLKIDARDGAVLRAREREIGREAR